MNKRSFVAAHANENFIDIWTLKPTAYFVYQSVLPVADVLTNCTVTVSNKCLNCS